MEPMPCRSITRSPSDPLYPNDLYRAQSLPYLARMLLDHHSRFTELRFPEMHPRRVAEAERFVENPPPAAEIEEYFKNNAPSEEEVRKLTKPLPREEELRKLSVDEFRRFLKAYVWDQCPEPAHDQVRRREFLYPMFEAIDRLQLEPNFLLDYGMKGTIWFTYILNFGLLWELLGLISDMGGPYRIPDRRDWETLARLPEGYTSQDIYLQGLRGPNWIP